MKCPNCGAELVGYKAKVVLERITEVDLPEKFKEYIKDVEHIDEFPGNEQQIWFCPKCGTGIQVVIPPQEKQPEVKADSTTYSPDSTTYFIETTYSTDEKPPAE